MNAQQILNVLSHASGFALLALSFTIPHRVCGFINVSHAVPFLLAPYAVLMLSRAIRTPFPGACAVLALLLAAMCGAVLHMFFAFVRQRRPSPSVLLIASLGVYTAFQNTVSMAFGDGPVSLRGTAPTTLFHIGEGVVTQWQLILCVCAVASAVLWYAATRFSRFGKSYRAVADNLEMAAVVGIRVRRVHIVAAFVVSFLAGLAGILVGYDTAVDPGAGLQALFMAVIVAVAGQFRIGGIWIISLLIASAQTIGTTRASSVWQNAFAFAILVLAVLVRDAPWGKAAWRRLLRAIGREGVE
jgi:branched-chain amino acid transport system permease protein